MAGWEGKRESSLDDLHVTQRRPEVVGYDNFSLILTRFAEGNGKKEGEIGQYQT